MSKCLKTYMSPRPQSIVPYHLSRKPCESYPHLKARLHEEEGGYSGHQPDLQLHAGLVGVKPPRVPATVWSWSADGVVGDGAQGPSFSC